MVCQQTVVLIFLCINLSPVVQCQKECNSDYLRYHSCMTQYRQNRLAAKQDPNKPNKDIVQCFLINGCNAPILRQIPLENQSDKLKMRTCYKHAQDYVRQPIQQCMIDVKQFQGFSLPQDNAWQGEPQEDPRTVSSSDYDARKQIPRLCQEYESRRPVRNCLAELKKNSSSFVELKENCDADKQCFEKMSQNCKNNFDKMKDTVCECASQTLGNLRSDLEKNFRSCYGKSTSDDDKLVGYLIKDICHLDDICVERIDTTTPSNIKLSRLIVI